MNRFGIIQLSDVQFGKKHVFGFPSKISGRLAADTRAMAAKYSFMPIALIVSGDVSETGHADEFNDALRELTALCQDLAIDQDLLLTIPGNHDVNWLLSQVSAQVGNNDLKLLNYNNFSKKLSNNNSFSSESTYPIIIDHRYCIKFLLLNSCEKETHDLHLGYVNPEKLVSTLKADKTKDYKTDKYLKVCVLHHRLDTSICDKRSAIENATEIESILASHQYCLILTGHVHQTIVHEVKRDNVAIVYSGCGSTGVNASQRADGVQNQYCIHVIDRSQGKFETYWRAFNPNSRTEFGLGGWSKDNCEAGDCSQFTVPEISIVSSTTNEIIQDVNLAKNLNIKSNPFTYSNAEKIGFDLILDLFTSDEARHKPAHRLVGDAIIRGPRGSGKTMFLRFLKIWGDKEFNLAVMEKRTAEALPVLINLAQIHNSELSTLDSTYQAADRLLYESVLEAIENKAKTLVSASFKEAVAKFKVRLDSMRNQEGTLISKMGKAFQEYLTAHSKHILILIDEIAPVFPESFFTEENGFLKWMNSIRNSGPFFTRVAVYPNDRSDKLNEERFGTIVNLEYQVRSHEDYVCFRKYCVDIVNKYLKSVSLNATDPATINKIIQIVDNDPKDPLEQLIYASDGSSRRFLSLMDKCLSQLVTPKTGELKPLDKDQIFAIIREFSNNLLTGYTPTDQALAHSIAKSCKKQNTFRFRVPGLSGVINNLYAVREELNIVKISEVGSGRRGSTYEFSYPYCILMDLQTHSLKETRKVCHTRDCITGEWITTVTTIQRDHLDFFNSEKRTIGLVEEIDGSVALITVNPNGKFLCEDVPEGLKIGDNVSFFEKDTLALDVAIVPY
ncbi:MAG: Phosphohydrolase [Pedosphaera sp.]|nr:Phosphohydrolase [Pedosphaera sp.]